MQSNGNPRKSKWEDILMRSQNTHNTRYTILTMSHFSNFHISITIETCCVCVFMRAIDIKSIDLLINVFRLVLNVSDLTLNWQQKIQINGTKTVENSSRLNGKKVMWKIELKWRKIYIIKHRHRRFAQFTVIALEFDSIQIRFKSI